MITHDWPLDADGDVFRRLLSHGFDFSKSHVVDFNVDFSLWPPLPAAIEALEAMHGQVSLYEPDENGDGYAQFQIYGPVTYESVMRIQSSTTAAMGPFGGRCDSWGVMQDAP
jgi:hypothetical protein